MLLQSWLPVIFSFALLVKTANTQKAGNTKLNITVRLVTWADNPPYYLPYHENLTHSGGIISWMVASKAFAVCRDGDIELQTVIDNPADHLASHNALVSLITEPNTTKIKAQLNITDDSKEIIVVSASAFDQKLQINPIFSRKLLLETRSISVIVRTKDIILLTKFLTGITECMGMTSFAILLSISLSAVVWVIEYMTGNLNFPTTFGKGLWTSFWYCFVTMTTVGYGDKVPKHFLTRILILVWMLFGLMMTAIITATVMTAVDNEVDTSGENVAVLNSTVESHYVYKILATPKKYETYDEILTALTEGEVKAAFVETTVASWLVKPQSGITIEHKIDLAMEVFAFVYKPETIKESCQFKEEETDEEISEQILSFYTIPYRVKQYKARKFHELLNKTDGGIILYLIIVDLVIIGVAILCEIVAKVREKRVKSSENFKSSPQYKRIEALEKSFQTIIASMLAEEVHNFKFEETKNPSYFVMSNLNTKM